jgi:hypothetical protein
MPGRSDPDLGFAPCSAASPGPTVHPIIHGRSSRGVLVGPTRGQPCHSRRGGRAASWIGRMPSSALGFHGTADRGRGAGNQGCRWMDRPPVSPCRARTGTERSGPASASTCERVWHHASGARTRVRRRAPRCRDRGAARASPLPGGGTPRTPCPRGTPHPLHQRLAAAGACHRSSPGGPVIVIVAPSDVSVASPLDRRSGERLQIGDLAGVLDPGNARACIWRCRPSPGKLLTKCRRSARSAPSRVLGSEGCVDAFRLGSRCPRGSAGAPSRERAVTAAGSEARLLQAA